MCGKETVSSIRVNAFPGQPCTIWESLMNWEWEWKENEARNMTLINFHYSQKEQRPLKFHQWEIYQDVHFGIHFVITGVLGILYFVEKWCIWIPAVFPVLPACALCSFICFQSLWIVLHSTSGRWNLSITSHSTLWSFVEHHMSQTSLLDCLKISQQHPFVYNLGGGLVRYNHRMLKFKFS